MPRSAGCSQRVIRRPRRALVPLGRARPSSHRLHRRGRARGHCVVQRITGAEHRVRIDFPQSFEFAQAEIASGTSKVSGSIALDLKDTYGQFAHIHLSHKGRLN
jgi:hypothetical protein